MSVRALITGIGGFAAGHLARCLAERGAVVIGTHRPATPPHGLPSSAQLLPADLEDPLSLAAAVRAAAPDWLFHLAGISSEIEAREQPARAHRINVLGTLHLLQALLPLERRPRVLIAGSSSAYGRVRPEENPITEAQPLRPVSAYGVSKAAQELLALQHHTEHGLDLIVARTFNHTGPGQRDGFSASSFARQIAEAEAGLRSPIVEVGDLSARRDFSDVRDIVRAYVALLEHGRPGEVYNVGSGQPVVIAELLDTLITLSPVTLQAARHPSRSRPVDMPLLAADPRKLREATGWLPLIPLRQTLGDLLASWRERVAPGARPGPK